MTRLQNISNKELEKLLEYCKETKGGLVVYPKYIWAEKLFRNYLKQYDTKH